MRVRLDKWLYIARAFKTRNQATRACSLGRVMVNGQRAKPHRILSLGDTVGVQRREWEQVFLVKELRDKPLPKAEAPRLYEDLSPPRPEPDPMTRLFRQRPGRRDPGAGRPTKRERRKLERLQSS